MNLDGAARPADNAGLDRLLGAVLAGSNQPLGRAETLPPAAYCSDAFYRIEVERIFRREWICVGHMAQLASVGDYYPHDLLDEMLVVVRGPDRVRVMSRICPHRWAPLVSEPGHARFLSCPFHKWAFALDGTLLGAPLMDRVEFDPATCRLTEYPTEVIDGFIYMSFDPEAASLAPRLAGLSARLEKFRLGELITGFTLDYDVGVNWKIIVETFMECYHHIAAHPETFEKMHPARLSFVEDGEAAWTIGHAPARPDLADEELLAGFPLFDGLSDEERHEFRLYLVYPFHLFFMLPDRAALFCLQPQGPTRTVFQCLFLVRPEARDDPAFASKLAAEQGFFELFNAEDIKINEAQQRGAATRSAQPGRLCDLEKACWQLAGFVRQRLAA